MQLGIILLGAPGSGKGTQSNLLSTHFNLLKIATGDMFRAEISSNSAFGLQIKSLVDSGSLIPDEITIEMVKNKIANSNQGYNGYLFDGFPRTINQAIALANAGITITHVIELDVPHDEIVLRISGRRVHPQSGRVYHITYNPPKQDMLDDITHEPLIQRPDDNVETVKNRLRIYDKEASALKDYYKNNISVHYSKINANDSLDAVTAAIIEVIAR